MRSRANVFSKPYTLEEQRQLAGEAGFRIVPAPDAPGGETPPPDFNDACRAAGAALFVRDYNLPIYPESAVADRELTAQALIEAARGETAPLSLGVHAIEALEGVRVEVGPLVDDNGTPLATVQVRVLEQAYMREKTDEDEKRAVLAHLRLRPNGGVDVPGGTNRQYWLDVAVPADAAPGEYRGLIRVHSSGRPSLSRLLTVRVRPYALEEPSDFFFGAFMTLRYFIPNRTALADFKAHGIDAMLWFYSPSVWTVHRRGDTITQEFHPLIRIVEDAMAVGMRGPIVIALGNDTVGYYEKEICREFDRPFRPAEPVDGKTAQVAAIDDEVVNRFYIEGIRQLLDVARERNWPEIVLLHYDEPTERLIPEAQHRYDQLKAAFPDVRIYGVTMNTLEWAEQLAPMSDILVCNGSFEEIRELAKREGKDVWGYGGSPAVAGAGGARFNMGLRLWQHGLGAHWFWCYNFYAGDPWNEFEGVGNANWVTVYPGLSPGDHVPTLAWEGIRQGYNDVRYCATLQRLLAEKSGPTRDEIAADYERFLVALPEGRDQTSYGVNQDDFYSTLPSYHRLTELRARLVEWIERLREDT